MADTAAPFAPFTLLLVDASAAKSTPTSASSETTGLRCRTCQINIHVVSLAVTASCAAKSESPNDSRPIPALPSDANVLIVRKQGDPKVDSAFSLILRLLFHSHLSGSRQALRLDHLLHVTVDISEPPTPVRGCSKSPRNSRSTHIARSSQNVSRCSGRSVRSLTAVNRFLVKLGLQ